MLAKTENQMLCVVVSVNIKHVLLKDIKLKYMSTTTTVKSLAAQKLLGKCGLFKRLNIRSFILCV